MASHLSPSHGDGDTNAPSRDFRAIRGAGQRIGPDRGDVVTRVALATRRKHGAAPLTGMPEFWERIAREAIAEFVTRRPMSVPAPEDVAMVAEAIAPAFAASPVTSSDKVWHAIIATVLTEYVAPSGMGEPIPFMALKRGIAVRHRP